MDDQVVLTGNWRKNRHIVSVWLTEDKEVKAFRCPQCTLMVIQYQGRMVKIIPGATPAVLPFFAQCRNKQCGILYEFVAIIDKE